MHHGFRLRARHVAACVFVAFAFLIAFGDWGAPSRGAQITIAVFVLATAGWSFTRVSDTTIALASAVALVATGVLSQEQFYDGLGNSLIWLIVAAFFIAAVLRETGLAQHLALSVVQNASSVSGLFYLLTGVICATALVIPTTSGRAAMLLPLFMSIAETLRAPRLVKALALLFPTIILLSAGGSLIGAGAHLIALDFIARSEPDVRIGYLWWFLIGMPLALVTSFIAANLILRMFLAPDDMRAKLQLPRVASGAWTPQMRYAAIVTAITILLWSTNRWHGASLALIGLGAAIALTIPRLSGVTIKSAAKATEWDLVLFLAATLLLGEAIIKSGAASWVATGLVSAVKAPLNDVPILVVFLVAMTAMAAHLLIASRSARAAILIPAVAVPLAAFGFSPAALILVTVMGTGYCQTLPASAKPVALYASLDQPTYSAHDLARLSLALFPVMLFFLIVFAVYVWPSLGIPLFATPRSANP